MEKPTWMKLSLSLLAMGFAQTLHAEPVTTIAAGMDYSEGKYGGTQTETILYLPIVGKYENGPYLFKLTVPFIRVTAPSGGNAVNANGVPVGGAGPLTTQQGLGDIVASATYSLPMEVTNTTVDLTGKVKFGTADRAKGLGTGEDDFSLQGDVYKTYDQVTALVTLGYKFKGNPPGGTLRDVLYGAIGGIYKFSSETTGGLILDLRQASSSLAAPQRELTGYVSQKIDKNRKYQLYLVKGLADGSPDYGLGLMVSNSF